MEKGKIQFTDNFDMMINDIIRQSQMKLDELSHHSHHSQHSQQTDEIKRDFFNYIKSNTMCTERIGEGAFGTVNQCRYYTEFEPFIAEKQIYCPSGDRKPTRKEICAPRYQTRKHSIKRSWNRNQRYSAR